MNINYEYLKRILETLKDSNPGFLTVNTVYDRTSEYDNRPKEEFHHHILLLFDDEIIRSESPEEPYTTASLDDCDASNSLIYNDDCTSIRLTMQGYRFLEALNHSKISELITKVRDGSFKILLGLAVEAVKKDLFPT